MSEGEAECLFPPASACFGPPAVPPAAIVDHLFLTGFDKPDILEPPFPPLSLLRRQWSIIHLTHITCLRSCADRWGLHTGLATLPNVYCQVRDGPVSFVYPGPPGHRPVSSTCGPAPSLLPRKRERMCGGRICPLNGLIWILTAALECLAADPLAGTSLTVHPPVKLDAPAATSDSVEPPSRYQILPHFAGRNLHLFILQAYVEVK